MVRNVYGMTLSSQKTEFVHGSKVSNAPTVQGMGEYTWSLFHLFASVCWASEIEVVCSLAFARGLMGRAHYFIVCTSLCCQSSSLAVLS